MSEHLTDEQIAAWRRRTLAPADLLRADDHLNACAACRARAGDPARDDAGLDALIGALAERAGVEDHLDDARLESYATGTAGDVERRVIEGHLAACAACAAEAEDLRAFVAEAAMQAGPRTKTAVESAVAPVAARAWRPTLFAALAAALVVAAAIAWLVPSTFRRAPGPDDPGGIAGGGGPGGTPDRPGSSPGPPDSPGARPLLVLDDAPGPVTLGADGVIAGLDGLAPEEIRVVATALRSGRVEVPADARALAGAEGVLLGGEPDPAALAPLAPVGTVVRSARPEFSWRPLAGATRYAVAVYDGAFRRVAESPATLTATSWVPSAPLAGGAIYTWQVTAWRGDRAISAPEPPAPEARFKVLSEADRAALESALDRAGDSSLAAGLILGRAGCLDEARRKLKTLADRNPEAPVARELLESLDRPR